MIYIIQGIEFFPLAAILWRIIKKEILIQGQQLKGLQYEKYGDWVFNRLIVYLKDTPVDMPHSKYKSATRSIS